MPKIAIIDTYYSDFLKSWRFNESASYETELNRLLDFSFGTGRGYSSNLRALGWDAVDIVANYGPLQNMWRREEEIRYGGSIGYVLRAQINRFRPQVVFFQDLSCMSAYDLSLLKKDGYILAGQCSCPMPPYENVAQFDVLLTSFPHYVKKFEEAGVRAVFNPLAFESRIFWKLDPGLAWREACDVHPEPERIHDVVFIGGTGTPSHWKRGMETLHAVAEAIPTFKWWGYGQDLLPDGPLKQKYQGQAWGLDMFRILAQSRIVLNRHGEVSEGYANNMKMFETCGMGALLLTEEAPNLREFFEPNEAVAYTSPDDAVQRIRGFLSEQYSSVAKGIAANGQARTLRDHTYAQRMRVVSDTLKEMINC